MTKDYPIALPLVDDDGNNIPNTSGVHELLVSGAGANYLYLSDGEFVGELVGMKYSVAEDCIFSVALEIYICENWIPFPDSEKSPAEGERTKWNGIYMNREMITKGSKIRIMVNAAAATAIYIQVIGFKR